MGDARVEDGDGGSSRPGQPVFVPGASVWIPDKDESWLEATVVSQEDPNLVVRITEEHRSKELLRVKAAECHPKDDDPRGVDDMTRLAYLHEPGVLHNILLRFQINQIYTYTGSILIAVNPFASIPKLYDEVMKEQYLGAPLGEQAPHVFAVADSAYRAMMREKKCQSILISGESGAGKTETTKLVMDYLATACGRTGGASEIRTIESLILESNPLLEAFGNAKTERNNNSSRFGKFIKVQFDKKGRVSGAAIKSYLLEKSRVVRVKKGERNYHVFYQLCSGVNQEEAKKYRLAKYQANDFYYLNQSDCFELEGKGRNAAEFVHLKRAMQQMGFTPEEQDGIFRTIAGILHLGNVSMEMGEAEDCVQIAAGQSKVHLEQAAELLRCNKEALTSSLLNSSMRVHRDTMIVPVKDIKSGEARRDSLAKNLYSTLFDWIVAKVNSAIGEDKEAEVFIGVLDIYGFEHFQLNSFEQFCINLANEKLQQHFNYHVLRTEQEEYEKEKINWSRIPFNDNQDCLDLIEGNRGILSLLDSACLVESTSPAMYTRKLFSEWAQHLRLSQPKMSQTEFNMEHYAGKVTYCTDEFIVKNKDSVIPEHFDLLSNSADPFVASLFPKVGQGQTLKNKFFSLGASFKMQLARLMEDINATEPHYVRCIKPNVEKAAHLFEKKFVVTQLQSGGVLEAVRMCSAGYPTRKEFREFLTRFRVLAPTRLDESKRPAEQVRALLELLHLHGYQIGSSKVFLRAGQMVELESRRLERVNAVRKIVDIVSSTIARRSGALVLQASWRALMARRNLRLKIETQAAVRIQAEFRMHRCREQLLAQRKACGVVQTLFRSRVDQQRYREARRIWAAIKIQSVWRGFVLMRPWRRLLALVRGRQARKEFHKMREVKVPRPVPMLVTPRPLRSSSPANGSSLGKSGSQLESSSTTLPRETLRYMVVRKLREKAEKAKQETAEILKVVQHENENLRLVLSQKDEELERLRDEYQHARQLALSATSTIQAVVGDIQSPHDREAFEMLEVGIQKTAEMAAKLKQENALLREAKQQADAKAAAAIAQAEEEKKEELRQLQEIGDREREEMTENSKKMEKSLAKKEYEIRVLAHHLLSGVQRPQLSPKHQQLALLKGIGGDHDLGFSPAGEPIAAAIVYRALEYWRAFETESLALFDLVMDTFSLADRDGSVHVLGYWLSNSLALYFLVHLRQPEKRVTFGKDDFRVRADQLNSELFLMKLGFSIIRLYRTIRDDVRGELLKILSGSGGTTASATKGAGNGHTKRRFSFSSSGREREREREAASYWPGIQEALSTLLETLRKDWVQPVIIRALFRQLVQFINLKIFNSLLVHSRWCPCTYSNGEAMQRALPGFKAWLEELDGWLDDAVGAPQLVPIAAELKHLEEAVALLVYGRKHEVSVEVLRELCPSLSPNQLWYLCHYYEDDQLCSAGVSPQVLEVLWREMGTAENAPELLQDNRRVPFSIEEVICNMTPYDAEDVSIPSSLLLSEAFLFLMPSTAEALSPLSSQLSAPSSPPSLSSPAQSGRQTPSSSPSVPRPTTRRISMGVFSPRPSDKPSGGPASGQKGTSLSELPPRSSKGGSRWR